LDSYNNPITVGAIDRIKFRLGRVGILSQEDAKNLPKDPYYKDTAEWNKNRQYF